MTPTMRRKIVEPTFTLRGQRHTFNGTRENLVEVAIDAGADVGDILCIATWGRTMRLVEDDEHGYWAR